MKYFLVIISILLVANILAFSLDITTDSNYSIEIKVDE